MKKTKLLTSLAAFVLVLGLGACNQPEEEETSSDESESTSQTTEGGTTDGGSGESETTTYKLGVLNENLYTYYYFDGTIDSGRFANGTATYDDAVALTLDEVEEGITLSWEADGKTYYLGYGLNESSQNCVIISEEVTYLKLNTTHNSIEDPDGKYFLGTYNEYTTMSWCGISYYDQDYIAHLYTEAQTNPTKPAEPEIDESKFETVKTGRLGVFQENLDYYYYFVGSKDGNFAKTTTEWDEAVEITLLKDENYYYMRFASGEEELYFANTNTSNSQVSLSESPYPMQYNEEYDAYLSTDGTRFIATYGSYTTLSWAELKYLGEETEFIAHIYESEQTQPEHEPEPELPENLITTTINYESVMNHEDFAEHSWATTKNTQDCFSTTEGVTTAFEGCAITWYTGSENASSNGCAIYTGSGDELSYSLRMYYGASIEISATEGYEIYSIVMNFTGSLSSFEFTNTTYTKDGNSYTLTVPQDESLPIGLKNTKTSSNTFTFSDDGIVVTLVPTEA